MQSEIPNHDQLVELAKSDPDRLEALRQTWVDEVIESAPEDTRKRLRGLQFQIDCQRRLHSSPMGACLEISRMMHESLNRLHNLLVNDRSEPEANHNVESATVLAFPSAAS